MIRLLHRQVGPPGVAARVLVAVVAAAAAGSGCSSTGGAGTGAVNVGEAQVEEAEVGSRRPPQGGGPQGGGSQEHDAAWSVVWRWPVPGGGSAGTPAGDDNGVVFVHSRRVVVMLDAQGRLLWHAGHDGMRDVAPLLTDDAVVVATEEGLAAFDRSDGALRWSVDAGDRANTPVVAGSLVVTTTWEGGVVAVDLGDGTVAWRSVLPGPIFGPPAVEARGGGAQALVATWDSGYSAGAVALDWATGGELWSLALAPDGVSPPAVVGGSAVVLAGDGVVQALRIEDGSEVWAVELSGAGSQEVSPTDAGGGSVVVAHRLGGLARITVATGEVVWTTPSSGAVVRGQVAGPSPRGSSALGLVDGSVVVGRDGSGPVLEPGSESPGGLASLNGIVNGLARGPGGQLIVATARSAQNEVVALAGW